jgi:hypothetical protein
MPIPRPAAAAPVRGFGGSSSRPAPVEHREESGKRPRIHNYSADALRLLVKRLTIMGKRWMPKAFPGRALENGNSGWESAVHRRSCQERESRSFSRRPGIANECIRGGPLPPETPIRWGRFVHGGQRGAVAATSRLQSFPAEAGRRMCPPQAADPNPADTKKPRLLSREAGALVVHRKRRRRDSNPQRLAPAAFRVRCLTN